MTRFYGLKPWELELLTSGELSEYLEQLDAYESDQLAQEAEHKRELQKARRSRKR